MFELFCPKKVIENVSQYQLKGAKISTHFYIIPISEFPCACNIELSIPSNRDGSIDLIFQNHQIYLFGEKATANWGANPENNQYRQKIKIFYKSTWNNLEIEVEKEITNIIDTIQRILKNDNLEAIQRLKITMPEDKIYV
jgi:hypothetical protein